MDITFHLTPGKNGNKCFSQNVKLYLQSDKFAKFVRCDVDEVCTHSYKQTLRQMHDAHTEARDQVPYGIFSDGVARQPAENGHPAQHRVPQPGH